MKDLRRSVDWQKWARTLVIVLTWLLSGHQLLWQRLAYRRDRCGQQAQRALVSGIQALLPAVEPPSENRSTLPDPEIALNASSGQCLGLLVTLSDRFGLRLTHCVQEVHQENETPLLALRWTLLGEYTELLEFLKAFHASCYRKRWKYLQLQWDPALEKVHLSMAVDLG